VLITFSISGNKMVLVDVIYINLKFKN